MSHILTLGIVVLVFALAMALIWRRYPQYRQAPRTRQDRRRFIAYLLSCMLLVTFFVATHFIHGDRLPGWISYLGDLAFGFAVIGISMIWNGANSARDAARGE